MEVLRWARENGCEWDSETCFCLCFRSHTNFILQSWTILNTESGLEVV